MSRPHWADRGAEQSSRARSARKPSIRYPSRVTEVLGEGRFLRLVREGRWEFVERVRTAGVVAMVAVTGDGELLLIEQTRPAIGGAQVELPAGLVDEGEDFEAAARRELMEETGFSAERFDPLGEAPPSSGLSSEVITFFRARGVHRVAEGGGIDGEDITLHLVPLPEVRAWLAAQAAAIDMKVYAGLFLAEL